jgi:lactam utilization protein B
MDELPAHLAWVVPRVRSLCVHGDGDHPVDRLTAVRAWLATHGVEVRAWTP